LIQQLSGRLGNQLFQWAFAHKLAINYRSQVSLFLDSFHANGFKGDDLYSHVDKCDHIGMIARNNFAGLIIKSLDKVSNLSDSFSYKVERNLGFLRSRNSYLIPVLPSNKPKLITGFFINSRNVEEIEKVIYPELQEILAKIQAPKNLPDKYQYIHIRRGDYVTTDSTYGLIGANHYKRFVSNNLPLVIGTDDSESAESVIRELKPELVFSSSDSTAWQALKMMGMAESLVLANSTLSWWGGFLASNRGKIVHSPSPFYKNDFKNDDLLQYYKFTKVSSEFLK
jgi:Glycosyl transferase family 11